MPFVAAGALVTAFLLGLLLWRATAEGRSQPGFRLSLCLIVRDQVDRLEWMLDRMLALASRWGACVDDVVLVDAGSQDGTADLVRALGRRHAGLKVLCWPADAPEGSALDAAQGACGAPWVLIARATGSAEAAQLEEGWPARSPAPSR